MTGRPYPITGQDIGKELCDALGLPKNTISFTLRAQVGHFVTVECEYAPEGREWLRELAEFHLVRQPETKAPAVAPMHYDDWLAQSKAIAHRDFMMRTSRRLPCDMAVCK